MPKKRIYRSKSSSIPRLPDAEMEVLACLWQHGEATARKIRDMMKSFRPMAHGSVLTLLKRLEGKGLVSKEKGPVGKAYIFKPTHKPGHAYRQIVKDLVQRIFRGNSIALAVSLFGTHTPTPEELDKLQQLLDQLRECSLKENQDGNPD